MILNLSFLRVDSGYLQIHTEHSWQSLPWPALRRRYGPVLPLVAASLTDFHVRRSAAIQAPVLNLAATSMCAAFLFNQFSLPMESQPYFKSAKHVFKWGRGSAAIQAAMLRLSLPRGGCAQLMSCVPIVFGTDNALVV